LGTDIEAARPKLKTLDRDVKEQLLKLARAHLTAYLTVGHGELNDAAKGKEDPGHSASIARTLLQKQNFTIKDLGLAQGLASEVPDDADVVMILGPIDPFSPEEISALRRYADRGGHLFITLDPDANGSQITTPVDAANGAEGTPVASATPAASTAAQTPPKPAPSAKPATPDKAEKPGDKSKAKEEPAESPPPGSAALAALAQLSYSPTVLANDHAHVRMAFNNSDQTRLISNSFSSHASVSTLSRNAPAAAVVFFGAGSLERGPDATYKIDFAVKAPGGSFADRNKNFVQDKDTEKANPFNIAAAVSHPVAGQPTTPPPAAADKKPGDKKPEAKEMRAFVVADTDAFSDLVMSNVRGNQFFMVDAVRWLVGEASFAGAETSEEDIHLESTKQQDLSWFYATIFGAPCAVLAAGVFISRRSRRAGGTKR
ncbi:MAG: Gldg family protein, partial [Polyangiaceae bacterium]